MDGVVKTWLDQDYNTQRHQLPSYRRLVKAVASKVGGSNPALAKKIADNHLGESVVLCVVLTCSHPFCNSSPMQ